MNLTEAVEHLQKARIPQAPATVRALAYIALAQTELRVLSGGGVEGLDDR